MAMLHFLFPQLGLFLCLALCFSPALSASDNDTCMVLEAVSTSDNLGNSIKAETSDEKNYTVSIPVNNSISAVILKAVNQDNSSVGSWDGASQKCKDSSVLYYRTSSDSSSDIFQTTWIAPNSENITKVKLQVFLVINNHTATMSSVRLEEKINPKISGTSQTKTMATDKTTAVATDKTTAVASDNTTAMTTAKTTAMASDNSTAMASDNSTAMTTAMASDNTTTMTTAKTTARSLAINALGSPLIGALHILLVFLISKLLF